MSMLRNSKGFTLVELMVVVIIVLVLAGIAVPVYIHYIQEGKKSEAYAVIDSVVSGALVYLQKNDTYTGGNFVNWLAEDDRVNAQYFSYAISGQSDAGFTVVATATGSWAGTPPGTVTWSQTLADAGAGNAGIGSFSEANW